MWNGKKISVAMPTYRERDAIRSCIERFFATGVVDEIVICNNNAEAGTSEEIAKTGAREVFEKRQGYGWSCRKALESATGDLIILSEPDNTFEPFDIFKLLAYSSDFDVVFGSRTNTLMIWNGANMGFFLKWGNWFAAKYMEFLFNTPSFTDVGCTMRLLNRQTLQKIQPRFKVGGNYFGAEMMLLCILSGARLIEIPLNYKERIGKSAVTGSRLKALSVGCSMLILITILRFRTWLRLER